jgi:hypothetical protein
MSIQNQINRISTAKNNIANAIKSKGVTVPANTKIDGYASLINSIEVGGSGGGDTAELCNVTISYGLDAWGVPGGAAEEYICVAYETVENGNRVVKVLGETDGETDDWGAALEFKNLQVVKGSLLFFSRYDYIYGDFAIDMLTIISNHQTNLRNSYTEYAGNGGVVAIVNADGYINVAY